MGRGRRGRGFGDRQLLWIIKGHLGAGGDLAAVLHQIGAHIVMAGRHAPLHPQAPGPVGGGGYVRNEGIIQVETHRRAGRAHAGGEKGAVVPGLDRADHHVSGIGTGGRGSAFARHAGGLVRLDHGGEGLLGGLARHRNRQGRLRLLGACAAAQVKQMIALT